MSKTTETSSPINASNPATVLNRDEVWAAVSAAQMRASARTMTRSETNDACDVFEAALAYAAKLDCPAFRVTIEADGGAVPNNYKDRAENTALRINFDGTFEAFRGRARKVARGDYGRCIATVERLDVEGNLTAFEAPAKTYADLDVGGRARAIRKYAGALKFGG